MSAARQSLGKRGERIAEEWLVRRGWRILDRRFRAGHRDIDLVASRDDLRNPPAAAGRTVAFVEVKARLTPLFGGPLGAVHWRKQRELARAARTWIASRAEPGDTFRFDVIGVVVGAAEPTVTHVENAFSVH